MPWSRGKTGGIFLLDTPVSGVVSTFNETLKSPDIQLTEQATHFSHVPPSADYRQMNQLLENGRGRMAR